MAYGRLLRNGLYALFGALISAILEFTLGPLIDVLKPQANGTIVLQSLQVVHDHSLLIILLAVAVAVIYGAVIERDRAPEPRRVR